MAMAGSVLAQQVRNCSKTRVEDVLLHLRMQRRTAADITMVQDVFTAWKLRVCTAFVMRKQCLEVDQKRFQSTADDDH